MLKISFRWPPPPPLPLSPLRPTAAVTTIPCPAAAAHTPQPQPQTPSIFALTQPSLLMGRPGSPRTANTRSRRRAVAPLRAPVYADAHATPQSRPSALCGAEAPPPSSHRHLRLRPFAPLAPRRGVEEVAAPSLLPTPCWSSDSIVAPKAPPLLAEGDGLLEDLARPEADQLSRPRSSTRSTLHVPTLFFPLSLAAPRPALARCPGPC